MTQYSPPGGIRPPGPPGMRQELTGRLEQRLVMPPLRTAPLSAEERAQLRRPLRTRTLRVDKTGEPESR